MTKVLGDGTLANGYSNFIAVSRYARWLEKENRRETWSETVARYMSHMKKVLGDALDAETEQELHDAILNHEVMPSMRALMTSGTALERENIAGYNCSGIVVDHPRAFDEAVYILMNGTGLGFNVERKYVEKLPVVSDSFNHSNTTIVVEDSKVGWAKSFRELIALLYQGQIPKWDVSKVRPAGARLKTFGGRASGPAPLVELFEFTIDKFVNAAGRKLKPIECHDIMCKIGDIVVVGGVRRSALISMSDLDDFEMATAKSGKWWETNGQRGLANNSAVYHAKPTIGQFMTEWQNLYNSKSGERGIVNMDSLKRHIDSFGRRDSSQIAVLNPCAEINLRNAGLCNLSEVVLSPEDGLEDVKRKVRLATIIGTYQSSLTNFKYVRKVWRDNAEEERLLGVSLTGIFGHKFYSGSEGLDELASHLKVLRDYAVDVNAEYAEKFGINPSVAVTTVKPSGTVSQLVGVSSGIHPWYAKHYIRTVRGDNKDPLTRLMKDSGVPNEPDVTKPDDITVFSFPMAAPEGAIVTSDLTAIEHLEVWKVYRNNWTEHNPSVTISVREHEWLEVGAWVYENFDSIGGISFLPYTEHTYKQAPYQEFSKEEFEELSSKMPEEIHWTDLSLYELEDTTTGTQELACVAASGSDACAVVDLT